MPIDGPVHIPVTQRGGELIMPDGRQFRGLDALVEFYRSSDIQQTNPFKLTYGAAHITDQLLTVRRFPATISTEI